MTRRGYIGRCVAFVAAASAIGSAMSVAMWRHGLWVWVPVMLTTLTAIAYAAHRFGRGWVRGYHQAKADNETPTMTIDGAGQVIHTHPPAKCAGTWCCIHNPSDHAMREWPLVAIPMPLGPVEMVRVCEHGHGHPDPDAHAFRLNTWGAASASSYALHACDGCCYVARVPVV